jgi:hypothetical protein
MAMTEGLNEITVTDTNGKPVAINLDMTFSRSAANIKLPVDQTVFEQAKREIQAYAEKQGVSEISVGNVGDSFFNIFMGSALMERSYAEEVPGTRVVSKLSTLEKGVETWSSHHGSRTYSSQPDKLVAKEQYVFQSPEEIEANLRSGKTDMFDKKRFEDAARASTTRSCEELVSVAKTVIDRYAHNPVWQFAAKVWLPLCI